MTSPDPQALTLRLQNDMVVCSTDDGGTVSLTPDVAAAIRSALPHELPTRYGVLTAAALGTLAESRTVTPTDVADPPAALHSLAGRTIALAVDRRNPLEALLRERRSRTDGDPPTLDDLAGVLTTVGRITGLRSDRAGGEETLRPTPSAGARHPINLLVVTASADGLDSGWWQFDPWRCQLVQRQLNVPPADYLATLRTYTPDSLSIHAAVVLTASFDRTLHRYPAGASLVWRDAGIVASFVHLAATGAGLDSCILAAAATLFPPAPGKYEYDVGAVAVARRQSVPRQGSDEVSP